MPRTTVEPPTEPEGRTRKAKATAQGRPGVTVRLSRGVHARVGRISRAEHRSVAAYIEALVERDLAARDEAERLVRVFSSPDLAGVPYAPVSRSEGESDERYAERSDALDRLFGHR
jgi:hypothetical protein